MIFGKTDAEKISQQQAKIAKHRGGVRRFKFLVQLANGRYVLCRRVWLYYHVYVADNGILSYWHSSQDEWSPLFDAHLDKSDAHICAKHGAPISLSKTPFKF